MAKQKQIVRKASIGTKLVTCLNSLNPKYQTWCQGLLFTTRDCTFDEIKQLVEEKLMNIPRFKSRYDFKKEAFVELSQDQIDRDYHVQQVKDEISLKEVTSTYLGDMYNSKDVDLDKPLWYCYFFPNLDDGRSLLFVNISHIIGDGLALIDLALNLTTPQEKENQHKNTEKNPDEEEAAVPEGKNVEHDASVRINKKRKVKNAYGLLNRFRIFTSGCFGALLAVGASPDSTTPLFQPREEGSNEKKRMAFTDVINLDKVKDIKNKIEDATVNDVLVGLLNLTLLRYLEEQGLTPKQIKKKKIRASFPINIRKKNEGFGRDGSPNNRFAIGLFRFVTKQDGSRAHLIHQVKRRIDRIKLSPYFHVQHRLSKIIRGCTSAKVSAKIVFDFVSQSTAQMSNVPGPQHQVDICGHPLLDFQFGLYAVMPCYLGVLTYDNKITCCVCLDGALGDPEEFAKHWKPEFEALYEEVMKQDGIIKRPRYFLDMF